MEPAFAQPTMVPKMKPSFERVPTAPPPAQPTQPVPLEVPERARVEPDLPLQKERPPPAQRTQAVEEARRMGEPER